MNTADVNRGYLKIEGAARAFNFDFKDKVVLDIGSSTGGFTEYALNHGAKKVIAVEKGSHQMKAPLRFDSRIDLHEKTDIFDVGIQREPSEGISERGNARVSALAPLDANYRGRNVRDKRTRATRPEKMLLSTPDIIVADVSFLSLTKVLEHAKYNLSDSHTVFLVMLKPQFEAKPDQLKNGVVKNETIRRQIIKQFEYWLKTNNFLVIKKRDNDLHGKTGNKERFYYLKLAK